MNIEQARRVVKEVLSGCMKFPTLDKGVLVNAGDAREAIAAALVKYTEGQEPVAWMWQHEETGLTGFVENASDEDLRKWERINRPRKIVTPCYTHPAPSQQEDRKPLTDEVIDSMWQNTDTGDCSMDGRAFARAIEAAHNIKEQK